MFFRQRFTALQVLFRLLVCHRRSLEGGFFQLAVDFDEHGPGRLVVTDLNVNLHHAALGFRKHNDIVETIYGPDDRDLSSTACRAAVMTDTE